MSNIKVAIVMAFSEHTMFMKMNLPPFGMGILSSFLQMQGMEVDLFDLNADFERFYAEKRFTKEDLKPFYHARQVFSYINGEEHEFFSSFIESFLADKNLDQYDYIGVSCGGDFSWLEIHSGFLIGRYIKNHYNKPVIFGGNNLDYVIQFKDAFKELWATVLKNFRFVVPGPGALALKEIIDHLEADPNWLPGLDFTGVVTLGEDGVIHQAPNKARQLVCPDYAGMDMTPYYNYVRDSSVADDPENAERWNLIQVFKWPSYITWKANLINSKHLGKGIKGKLVMPYIFNYNCPYDCAFCTESLERLKVVHATVDQVLNDMLALMEKYDTNYFFFFNNYFNLSKRFVKEFCQEVIRRGIEFYWSDCARFNYLDFDTLKLMKDAGCAKLTFGLETASPKMLSLIDKRVKLDQAEQVLKWCKELGIWSDLEIIVGMPNEYEEDFEETANFLHRNSDLINFFNINRYFVVPRSLMGAYPEQYGMTLELDPDIHQQLLTANYQWLESGRDLVYKPQNFRVYKIQEIGGRNDDEIAAATNKKVKALNGIQSREFIEAWQMLNIMDGQLSKTPMPDRLTNERVMV